MQVNGLISKTKGVLKSVEQSVESSYFSPATFVRRLERKSASKTKVNLSLYIVVVETHCLRLRVSRATSFVDSVNSSERVRGIIG